MSGRKTFHTDHKDPLIQRLETIRERLRYSQHQMAEALGVPFRTYQKWVYSKQSPRHGRVLLARGEALIPAKRINCWEILRCGREPGGPNVESKGGCPAAVDQDADGVNNGQNGGRVCWAISGTFCEPQAQGSEAVRLLSCFSCDFITQVLREEGLANFKLLKIGQTYTQK